MIDIERAKRAFKEYVSKYNEEDDKIRLKIIHTYDTVNAAKYIANDLGLDKEDCDLAELIALLHDIGRFEQVKRYNSFDDHTTIDHADFGVEILEENNLLREFVEKDIYDSIIKTAIKYHNNYKMPEGLGEKEDLHIKIIRDADKLDNFNVKQVVSPEVLFGITMEELEKEYVSEHIYNTFLNRKLILVTDRVTNMDKWVSYLAFIFDYNFSSGLKYIKEKDYINILVDRVKYKNEDTKQKMEVIRKVALEYIEERIK